MFIKRAKITINSKTSTWLCLFPKWQMWIFIPTVLNTSRPGRYQELLIFKQFPENPKICIIACIEEYKKRTLVLRNHSTGNGKQFIISYAPPHNPITSAAIARQIKPVIELAGICITVFTARSTRCSSISEANNAGLSIKDLEKATGLSSSSTFTKHYKLPIQKSFGSVILERHSHQ